MSATQRPFKVLGIQQVAIGGTDKQRMKTLWVDMLGLESRKSPPCTPRR